MATVDSQLHSTNQVDVQQRDNDTDHKEQTGEPLNPDLSKENIPNDYSKTQSLHTLNNMNRQQTSGQQPETPYESVVEYDPFVTPPDLDKARVHLIASRIALDPKNKENLGEVIDHIASEVEKIPTKKLMEEIQMKPDINRSGFLKMSIGAEGFACLNELEKYFQDWEKKTKANQARRVKENSGKEATYSSEKPASQGQKGQLQDEESKALVHSEQAVTSCPCCNRRAKLEKIKLNEGVSQIGNLGAGYVLFFKMNVMVNFINIFNLLASLYPIIRNSLSTSCKKEADSIGVTTYAKSSSLPNCHLDFTSITSLANYNVLAWDIIERVLLLLSMFTVVIMSCFWRISIKTISDKYESRADGPEDWTLLLKNIAPEHAQKIFIKNEDEEPILNLDDYVKALISNCIQKSKAVMDEEDKEEKDRKNPKINAIKPALKDKSNYEKISNREIQVNPINSHSSVANLKSQEKAAADLDPDPKASSAADLNKSKIDMADANQNKKEQKDRSTNVPSKYSVISTNYLYKCKELVALDKNLTKMKKELRTLLEKEPAKDKQENEKLKDMLNPQMNKKQFLGQVADGVDNQINLDDFSLDFQIKFTKALFVSSKVPLTYLVTGHPQRNPRRKKEVLPRRGLCHFQDHRNGARLQEAVQKVQRRFRRELSAQR